MKILSTTVLGVLRNGKAAMACDGQVTMNESVLKRGAKKIRTLYQGKVLAGFAGAGADCLTLLDRFEEKLNSYSGNLARAAIELAKMWRTDKVLRHLEALLLAMDLEHVLIISGKGDVIEPDESIAAIGSGGNYALAAAKALYRNTDMNSEVIARRSLEIAAEICIYTNDQIYLETLE
ncbi:ATP-dependent protease subunit HslV [Atribacter laminatus]|jgi:ATP-dependent HslUV protease subunit HslV|uniref:ATP-dependent protease subunit HslV n=1 Tax=Atribacter laminatus TaxID=2847778 RepID=A0A7T1ANR4_ATRLM|nr:ATP-dependent protease subunit HslV [Atribacter laminatus]QPM69292.1 ATP-dependent protease subunit ClpQ [Atribacter laminatus]